MDWITIVVIVLFAVVAAVCVLLALLGLAGTWIMLAIALSVEFLDTYWSDGETWGWTTLGVCFGLAVIGEIMEMGADAVLVNTAIATAADPVQMAEAFKLAVKAGRAAYEAGPRAVGRQADASSPLTGFLRD